MARLANLLCVINPRLMEKGRKAAHYNQAASWVSRCSSGAKPFKCRIIRLIYACWRRASYWRCPTCGMHDPVSGRSSVYQGHPCFRPVVPLQLRVEEGSMRILVIALFSTLNCSGRSEEHTSELQSPDHLVCRLLLEKKKPAARGSVPGGSY